MQRNLFHQAASPVLLASPTIFDTKFKQKPVAVSMPGVPPLGRNPRVARFRNSGTLLACRAGSLEESERTGAQDTRAGETARHGTSVEACLLEAFSSESNESLGHTLLPDVILHLECQASGCQSTVATADAHRRRRRARSVCSPGHSN